MQPLVVLSTAGSQEEAGKIAHALVEQRVAACVNVLPEIRSIYRWQGKVESATEWLLIIKTNSEQLAAIRDLIQKLHSYELPECIAIPITGGSGAYLDWLVTESS